MRSHPHAHMHACMQSKMHARSHKRMQAHDMQVVMAPTQHHHHHRRRRQPRCRHRLPSCEGARVWVGVCVRMRGSACDSRGLRACEVCVCMFEGLCAWGVCLHGGSFSNFKVYIYMHANPFVRVPACLQYRFIGLASVI